MTHAGEKFWKRLTEREREIVAMLCQTSDTTVDLAAAARSSVETMKRHISNIYQKAGMSTRLELVFFCCGNGVCDCPCGRKATMPVDAGC